MTEVPVVVLDHLSETQGRALVLADNRLAPSAGWDEEMRIELDSMKADSFDLDLVGFTYAELEKLLRDPETTGDGLTGRHRSGRRLDARPSPVALRRRDADGRCREGSGRRLG